MAVEFVDVSDIHLRDIRFQVTRADGRVLDFSDVVSEFNWMDNVNTAGAEVNMQIVGTVTDVLKIGGEGSSANITAPLVDLDTGLLVRRELWQGTFEEVIDNRGEGSIERTVTGYDIARYLTSNEEDYVFKNSTLSSVVTKVASDFSIPVGAIDTTTKTLGLIVSRGGTLWSLLQEAVQRHADLTGEVFYVFATSGKLEMRKQGSQSRFWVFEYGESVSAVRRTRALGQMINRVKIYGVFEGESDKPVVESIRENETSQGLYGLRQRIEYLNSAEDEVRVAAIADKVLDQFSAADEVVEITGWLVPNLRAGEQIRFVDEEWGLNRLYFVESIDSTWSTERAESIATCRRVAIDPGLLLAEVKSV